MEELYFVLYATIAGIIGYFIIGTIITFKEFLENMNNFLTGKKPFQQNTYNINCTLEEFNKLKK